MNRTVRVTTRAATMQQEQALEIANATVRFDGRAVLEGFSMSLRAGEKAVLTGPSGGGKSTVLRCFLGFVVPQAGSVHIEGTSLTAETAWQLRTRLAYVGQEPDLGHGTAREAIERPFHYRANAALRPNLERLPEFFERFGLSEALLHKDVGALSGGEKQRVALISAILLDRHIFLLDEITSALDKASKQVVADYFRSRDDATALIVAHDPELFAFAGQTIEVRGRRSAGGRDHE
jgi:ABC-type iron transport system FetAB ATPase subunit